MLTGDSRQIGLTGFQRLGVGDGLTEADVQDDLFQARNLHDIFKLHPLHHLRDYFFLIFLFKL